MGDFFFFEYQNDHSLNSMYTDKLEQFQKPSHTKRNLLILEEEKARYRDEKYPMAFGFECIFLDQ